MNEPEVRSSLENYIPRILNPIFYLKYLPLNQTKNSCALTITKLIHRCTFGLALCFKTATTHCLIEITR